MSARYAPIRKLNTETRNICAITKNGDIGRIQKLMIETLESESKRCDEGNILGAGWCPEIWDKILCWNSTAPGQLAVQQCPSYIVGFDSHAFASKQCMPNGQWFWNVETANAWTNYTQCYQEQLVTVLMNISDVQANNVSLIKKYFPVVKTISKLGYSISLFTLIIAFCILATINLSPIGRRKLRCPRNILHMHLFASFVMRAFMALLKDMLFVSGIGLAEAVIKVDGDYWLIDENDGNWHCKVFTSLWQYFILANYSWILMEGIYLHNLVFMALFTDANSSIIGYVVFGWGLPAVFILPWVVTRIIFEDTYCWTTNVKPLLFLFIRVPTMLSILGFFVAVLYCFLNGEVRAEVSRALRGVKWTHLRGIRWGQRSSTHSVSTCSCNNVAKSSGRRHSRRSRWWKSRWKTPSCLFQDRAIRRSTHSMASTQDVGTRGGSLASSRGYLEIAGNGQPPTQNHHVHHTSPLCSKYTDQSLLSFCSNMSDASGPNIDRTRDQHRWSDSECCHLAYELHNLQQQQQQQHHGQP
ncbi:hypothetical protein P5V15_008565 [Pogonomyrmex californicus]